MVPMTENEYGYEGDSNHESTAGGVAVMFPWQAARGVMKRGRDSMMSSLW